MPEDPLRIGEKQEIRRSWMKDFIWTAKKRKENCGDGIALGIW